MLKIYCAGPLFNRKEKEEMQEIADTLESHGYDVFLPQRDGFEFANLLSVFSNIGVSESIARGILNKAIFALDVFQVLNSQGLVLNMNGRVPDEGAMVEAGIAWSSGKNIVIYKNDARTLLNGNDNPLLLGLSDFKVVNNIQDLPQAFAHTQINTSNGINAIDTTTLSGFFEKGKQIASLASTTMDQVAVCRKLMELLEDMGAGNELNRL